MLKQYEMKCSYTVEIDQENKELLLKDMYDITQTVMQQHGARFIGIWELIEDQDK